MGVLIETFAALGFKVRWCSCKIFSHTAAAIAKAGASTVFVWKRQLFTTTSSSLSTCAGAGTARMTKTRRRRSSTVRRGKATSTARTRSRSTRRHDARGPPLETDTPPPQPKGTSSAGRLDAKVYASGKASHPGPDPMMDALMQQLRPLLEKLISGRSSKTSSSKGPRQQHCGAPGPAAGPPQQRQPQPVYAPKQQADMQTAQKQTRKDDATRTPKTTGKAVRSHTKRLPPIVGISAPRTGSTWS